MKRLGLIGACAALATLGGCGGGQASGTADPAAKTTAAPVDTRPHITLQPDGILAVSAAGPQHEAFAVTREPVVAAVTAALGDPTAQGSNAECSAGPMENVDFAGGLRLFFQDGKFVGWSIDGRTPSPHKTAQGIGIGSSVQKLREAMDVMVQDTSLGVEFQAGDIGGLVTSNTPDGKVLDIWAGTTCAFR